MFDTFGEVKWILHNYHTFQMGQWPDPGHAIDLGIPSSRISTRAPFENPCLVAGELGNRVKLCGTDGLWTFWRFGMGFSQVSVPENVLAHQWHVKVREIHSRINKVIAFCASGQDVRTENYEDFKRRVIYRHPVSATQRKNI